jgi:hypothetical protein
MVSGVGCLHLQRLRDDVAGKLGVPPRLVEAVAVTSLVGLTAAAAASVLAFALPAVLLASTALPGLLFMLFVVMSMGALVSTFVPVLVRSTWLTRAHRFEPRCDEVC